MTYIILRDGLVSQRNGAGLILYALSVSGRESLRLPMWQIILFLGPSVVMMDSMTGIIFRAYARHATMRRVREIRKLLISGNMRSELYNIDCLEYMKTLPDGSVDVICTDPPYKYLDHKLDRDFDEQVFFDEAIRVLKDGGWIILFGRGTSFYRWNTMLHERGMVFKEEVIWNKQYGGTVFNALNRMHETISISVKRKGNLFKNKVPYIEKREYNTDEMRQDIKRLLPVIGNCYELQSLLSYLDEGVIYSNSIRKRSININSETKSINRVVGTMRTIREGIKESSIIQIINNTRGNIHPTQKPVRLIERLLQLVTRGGLYWTLSADQAHVGLPVITLDLTS